MKSDLSYYRISIQQNINKLEVLVEHTHHLLRSLYMYIYIYFSMPLLRSTYSL